ncbi:hypothetical protein V2J09_012834 [Rumex salicifolius]
MEALAAPWKCSVIIKFLGRMISFPVFEQRLKQLWCPSGGMVISDLLNNFFLVRFELDSDPQGALTGGPWTMFGHYMMVKQWSIEFNPQTSVINSTGVWVRISRLSMMMYDRNLLFAISSTIENPLRIDNNTLNATRGRFAKVCIEVDLTKPLKGEMFVNGERLQIEYENLHLICFTCGRYGHDCDHCSFNTNKDPPEEAQKGEQPENRTLEINIGDNHGRKTPAEKPTVHVVGVRPWGPWMDASSKRTPRLPRQRTIEQAAKVATDNRYASLQEEGAVETILVQNSDKGKAVAGSSQTAAAV